MPMTGPGAPTKIEVRPEMLKPAETPATAIAAVKVLARKNQPLCVICSVTVIWGVTVTGTGDVTRNDVTGDGGGDIDSVTGGDGAVTRVGVVAVPVLPSAALFRAR